jgi:hypothetical protein
MSKEAKGATFEELQQWWAEQCRAQREAVAAIPKECREEDAAREQSQRLPTLEGLPRAEQVVGRDLAELQRNWRQHETASKGVLGVGGAYYGAVSGVGVNTGGTGIPIGAMRAVAAEYRAPGKVFTRAEVLAVLRSRKATFPAVADPMSVGQQNELTALISIFERME